MARIAQTIDVNVSPDIAYRELMRFEAYPQFVSDVIDVRRVDERRLHWRATLGGHDVSWEMEITGDRPAQGFTWRGLRFPHEGRVDIQPSDNGARIAVTIDGDFRLPQDNAEAILSQRLQQDLVRFKRHLESRHGAPGQHAASSASASASSAAASTSSSSYAAGSEGWDGNEDPGMPVVSSTPDNAGQFGRSPQPQNTGLQTGADVPQAQAGAANTQSAPSLSRQDASGQGGARVAEEVSLDQQPAQDRRVGQMPEKPVGASVSGSVNPAEAMAQSMGGGEEAQGAASRPQETPAGHSGDKAAGQSAHGATGRHQAGHAGEPSWLPNLMQAIEEPMAVMRKMSGEVDQLFERFVGRPMFGGRGAQHGGPAAEAGERSEAGAKWMPVVEVSRQGDKVVVSAELPGVQRKDVHVEVQHDALIIEGERHDQRQFAHGDRLHSERSYGHFYRMISLPRGIDPDAASASMQDGVLHVTLPIRSTPQQGRRIDIGG